jgi:hypothetical protein
VFDCRLHHSIGTCWLPAAWYVCPRGRSDREGGIGVALTTPLRAP